MRILFITTGNVFGNSSGNIRNLALLAGLRQDHEIDLVTLHYNTNKGAEAEEVLLGIPIFEIANSSLQMTFSTNGQNNKARIVKLKQLMKYALISLYKKFQVYDLYKRAITTQKVKQLPLEKKHYDMMISSSDPRSSHYLARKIRDIFCFTCPWVQYWGDPMFGDVASNTVLTWHTKQLEKEYISLADVCFYTNPLAANGIIKRYGVSKDKIRFVPTSTILKMHSVEANDYVVGYFGDYLSKWRNILPIYQVITDQSLPSIIIGQGDVELAETKCCSIAERKPLSEVQDLMSRTQILVCICNTGENCIQIPGKVYHYALTDKKILVIGANEKTIEFLSSYNRYSFCDNTVQSISEAIAKLMADQNKRSACDDFAPHHVAESFICQVEDVIRNKTID